jgi:hypothetical protein
MRRHWIPWKFFIGRIAKRYGFIDPLSLLARLRRFSQPSEVQEPLELLRAGMQFHARGLINTKAIQHNLDWIWPYWVEKQFNPSDLSFIPRSFSISHINLTQRNWTAVGLPDVSIYPIIDPRGLVTPLFNGWSIDFWVYAAGEFLIPSRVPYAWQCLHVIPSLEVETRCSGKNLEIATAASMVLRSRNPFLNIKIQAASRSDGWLAVALRPYNPEGVQFIERIEYDKTPPRWIVDGSTRINMSEPPEKMLFSNYEEGDVFHKVTDKATDRSITCNVGMASSAALFPITGGLPKKIEVCVPIYDKEPSHIMSKPVQCIRAEKWPEVIEGTAQLSVPDARMQFLYEAAIRSLVLFSAGDVVPGPYTYRRFWFRDATFMIHALCVTGFIERVRCLLALFPQRQKRSGFFHSQEGEWDSNGQVLWLLDRFQKISNDPLGKKDMASILKGARWIEKKRLPRTGRFRHDGLLPAGFSAEHLGPNDFYYWDDFWSLAGLEGASRIVGRFGSIRKQKKLQELAEDLKGSINESIAAIPIKTSQGAIPASPYRRLDAGAVGSLVADYPLQITPPGDSRIMKTIEFLIANSFHSGAFFQDMIHSGINPYLTLMIAQSLLRAGDHRYREMVLRVAELASDTGQWPEAIHPFSGGGCMGDGQHAWAAAEWVMMMRNIFVREEGEGFILGSGLFPQWLDTGQEMFFGPTSTAFGDLSIYIIPFQRSFRFVIEAEFGDEWPDMEIQVPGYRPIYVAKPQKTYLLEVLQE